MSPTFQPDGPGHVELIIGANVTAFAAAMERVRRTAEEAAARLDFVRRDMRAVGRRQRRHRTHVWEHPEASRMHAAYTAKTRRRNRR